MATPRKCPHCHATIPADRGFSFDEKLNLICGACGKIAFPATPEAEQQPPRNLPPGRPGPFTTQRRQDFSNYGEDDTPEG